MADLAGMADMTGLTAAVGLAGAAGGPAAPAVAEHTAATLAADLVRLGLRPGRTLLVQASTRSIGAVQGGTGAIVRALREVLGPQGTLVAYTATPENSATSRLHKERTRGMGVGELAGYWAAMPGFDPDTTPVSPTVGRLSEEIRTTPGARRSTHPQTSFAAVGARAEAIVANHALGCHLGEDSPTARLYDADALALLIGVPLWCCTAYHLADYRARSMPDRPYGCWVMGADGVREWLEFEAADVDDQHFPVLGEVVREALAPVRGTFGSAHCWLVPIKGAVDTATKWLLKQEG
jgi:aminoglycoside 3-N-acetyltransferase